VWECTEAGLLLLLLLFLDDTREVTLAIEARVITVFLTGSSATLVLSSSFSSSVVGDDGVNLESGRSLETRLASLARVSWIIRPAGEIPADRPTVLSLAAELVLMEDLAVRTELAREWTLLLSLMEEGPRLLELALRLRTVARMLGASLSVSRRDV
jgi:hypothetical protein